MEQRHPADPGPPISLAWRCTGCGFYQLLDRPAPKPPFCRLCGSMQMERAGLTDPVGSSGRSR